MRHFIFLGAMAGVLALSGCGAVNMVKPDMDKCFSAQAEIRVGGETIKGEISRTAKYCWEMTVSEPFALEGLIITADKEGTTLSMCGFESNGDVSDEAVTVLRLIMDAYEGAVKGECDFSESCFVGTNQNGGYQLTVSSENQPDTLKISEKGVAVKLTEWEEIVFEEELIIDE